MAPTRYAGRKRGARRLREQFRHRRATQSGQLAAGREIPRIAARTKRQRAK